MIQKSFGDGAISMAQIKVWHKHFKDGWESVESVPCSGRPAIGRTHENVECVLAAINKDWQLTSARTRGWSRYPQIYCVWDFDTGWLEVCCGKISSAASLPEQKEHCDAVANDLIQTTANEPDFLKVITGDESWENCVRSQGANFKGDWGVIVLCAVFLVSCIFFNKCLYSSYYVAEYFMDRTLYIANF